MMKSIPQSNAQKTKLFGFFYYKGDGYGGFKIPITYTQPVNAYPVYCRLHEPEMINGRTLSNCYRMASHIQRLIQFTDALELKRRPHGIPVRSHDVGFDHAYAFGTRREWLVLDSPYGQYDRHKLKSDWRSVWLPRQCDPYFPGTTYARLSAHKTSTINLEEAVERVSQLNFDISTTNCERK